MAIVTGTPMTYGSKKGFVIHPKGGGKPRAIIANDNPAGLKAWQDALRQNMQRAAAQVGHKIITEPIEATIIVYLRRPNSHYRTKHGEMTTELKDSAPSRPLKKPDGDKVERAVWDCMKGVWIIDDTHICDWYGKKRYAKVGEPEKTVVMISW